MKISKLTPTVKAFGLVYKIKIDQNISKALLHKHNIHIHTPYMRNVCYTIQFSGSDQSYFSNRLKFKCYNGTNFCFPFCFSANIFLRIYLFPILLCKQC